ncbi:hypothetical protein BV898_06965 [Hypsibius exemplaris]|uniref:F-box domain-containing protein n=1 Tax=Hypsibius exemplaris TaxID=2072580 RepID=A0A1W0WUS9_HYPEX|nr:hypothetical protein BV898_06965 [Hypsibius exemplaris]
MRPEDTLIIEDVPGEFIQELFQWCDLRTRCKLRRVCRYWQYLICLPENREVIWIDHNFLKCRPVPITEETRNKLMGPCVRLVVFTDCGCREDFDLKFPVPMLPFSETYRDGCLFHLGRACPNTRHLILRNVLIQQWRSWEWAGKKRALFQGFLQLESLTLVASMIRISVDTHYDFALFRGMLLDGMRRYGVDTEVQVLTMDWTAAESTTPPSSTPSSSTPSSSTPSSSTPPSSTPSSSTPPSSLETAGRVPVAQLNLNRFIWPLPSAQRDWVAIHAPLLPKAYHNWAAFRPEVYWLLEKQVTGKDTMDKFNLQTVDYSTVSPSLLRILASCIISEGVPCLYEAPYSLVTPRRHKSRLSV